MEKEYIVIEPDAKLYNLEDNLNSFAGQGYEFCGMVQDYGGFPRIVMRKKPEMDNSDVSEDLYSEPQETPEQKRERILKEVGFDNW